MKKEFDLGLRPADELFETDESREDRKRERLMDIPIVQISDFPDHPYLVKDDESMQELVDSVKEHGLLQPVLVRPTGEDKYEMVSGHRRKRAFEIAGIPTIPARVREMTHDEAVLAMVDSNLQREEILPSEKARAYKMRLEAMKRQQGTRTDLTSVPVGQKSTTRELIANSSPDSNTQIQRFIRLTELIPSLLQLVDDHKIALRPAVEISYLTQDEQSILCDTIGFCDATPSHAQAIKMRKFSEEGKLTAEVIESIMEEEKPNQHDWSQFRDERIRNLIPSNVPRERAADYVVIALEYYNRFGRKPHKDQETSR